MGDGTQVFGQFLDGHANAGVFDGEGVVIGVKGDPDCQLCLRVEHFAVGQHLKIHARQGVRGIRNELTQKDFALGIKRMDQDI